MTPDEEDKELEVETKIVNHKFYSFMGSIVFVAILLSIIGLDGLLIFFGMEMALFVHLVYRLIVVNI